MSVLVKNPPPTNCNDYLSGLFDGYNKQKHDLYTWTYPAWPESEPIFGSLTNPGQWGGLLPNGYNSQNYINDSEYIPDFSGKTTRPRQYGRTQTGDAYAFFGLRTCIPSDPTTANTQQQALIRNIGNWHSGSPTGVLISPRHVIICGHFVGYPSTLTFNFLLKNGTNIVITGQRITRANGTELTDGDMRVFRLSENLETYINNNLITCYSDYLDITDTNTFNYLNQNYSTGLNQPNNIIGWRIDGGDRVIRGGCTWSLNDNDFVRFDDNPNLLSDSDIDDYQVNVGSIFTGDSGSPKFIYDINSKKTILIGLAFGGELNHIETNNLIYVQQELNSFGYTLNKLNTNNLTLLTLKDLKPTTSNSIASYTEYKNTFDNIETPPLYRYPYSSRIYNP